MSLFTSMFTGVSGLKNSQTSMNTVAHNLANVDSKGYTRQQILTSSYAYISVGSNHLGLKQIGLGNDMQAIRQVRDVFMDKNYRLEIGSAGFYEKQWETAEEVESLFGEFQGTEFSSDLSGLWSAISEMAKTPESLVNRGLVISTANSFIKRAKIISTQLNEYQESLNTDVQKEVDRINAIGDRIHELNNAIMKYESGGQRANDYRDDRNLLLDELAGYVNITYKEQMDGRVNVSVEGQQFVTDSRVVHMKTEYIVTDEEKERAEAVKRCADALAAAGTEAGMKALPEWNELKQYGSVSFIYDTDAVTGARTLKGLQFNDYTLIDLTAAAGSQVTDVQPKRSNLYNVVWDESKAGNVFQLNGDYSKEKQNDIGSLKGLLVSMGTYPADYSDVPIEPKLSDYGLEKEPDPADYTGGATDPEYIAAKEKFDQYETDYDAYEKKLEIFNKYVEPSIIMSTQAKFDQLLHGIVTAVNDILSPNTEINQVSLNNLLKVNGNPELTADMSPAGRAAITVTLADGSQVDYDEIEIFDQYHSAVGMDENQTTGEGLFNRKNKERYTMATIEFKDNNGDTQTINVRVYNKENQNDPTTLYSIDELEINSAMSNDPSMIPLSANEWSGSLEGYDWSVCDKLLEAWKTEGIQIDPNSATSYNFVDYYAALTTDDIAFKGSTYKGMMESQQELAYLIDDNRQSNLGVSSDEELTNLVRFQHAYNASSRYITVVSDMLEYLIDRLGA